MISPGLLTARQEAGAKRPSFSQIWAIAMDNEPWKSMIYLGIMAVSHGYLRLLEGTKKKLYIGIVVDTILSGYKGWTKTYQN